MKSSSISGRCSCGGCRSVDTLHRPPGPAQRSRVRRRRDAGLLAHPPRARRSGRRRCSARARHRQDVADLRHRLGLDRPLYVQYAAFMRGPPRGDLGRSLRTGDSRSRRRSPSGCRPPLSWPLAAMLVALLVAVPLGIVAAVSRRHGGRSRRDNAGAARHLDARVLARADAGPRLRRGARMAAGLRPRHRRAPRAARDHPGRAAGSRPCADDAGQRARGAAGAVRARGARARRLASSRGAAPCVSQQPYADRHGGRPAVRRRADGRCHHRDDLRVAGRRPPARAVDHLPRLPAGARVHPAHRRHLCHREPADRSRVRRCSIPRIRYE